METDYLLFALLTATFGFALWYGISSSLNLPKSLQIQYDINISYFNRIIRRRLAGFLIYFLLPYWLLFRYGLYGNWTMADLGINFGWSSKATLWILILVPLMVVFVWWKAKKRFNLVEYPEIRVRIYTPFLLVISGITWILYLLGVEFLFRGLVLESVLMNGGSEWAAIFISTGLYALTHFYKNNLISLFWIPFGILLAFVTIKSDSLLPAILIQIAGAFANEWIAINMHPEVQVQSKLY